MPIWPSTCESVEPMSRGSNTSTTASSSSRETLSVRRRDGGSCATRCRTTWPLDAQSAGRPVATTKTTTAPIGVRPPKVVLYSQADAQWAPQAFRQRLVGAAERAEHGPDHHQQERQRGPQPLVDLAGQRRG